MSRQITIQDLAEAEVLDEIFDKLDTEIKNRFITTNLNDVEELRTLRYMAHAAEEVRRFIRASVQEELINDTESNTTIK